jgi:c-di-GMP-binding flagellar brake protein YcgR
MEEVKFLVNHKVEIFYADDNYKSNIQDITEEYISISIPMKEGRYIALNSNDYFEVLYYEEANVYKFVGKVIRRILENGVSQILLEYPEDIVKIQRREYVRIDFVQYLKYITVSKGEKEDTKIELLNNGKGKEGLLIDLSGGGFKFKTSEKIEYDDVIIADIPDDESILRVRAKAVRISIDTDKKFICGFSFIDIDNKTRERIIRFIFSIMRKQRKNQ